MKMVGIQSLFYTVPRTPRNVNLLILLRCPKIEGNCKEEKKRVFLGTSAKLVNFTLRLGFWVNIEREREC